MMNKKVVTQINDRAGIVFILIGLLLGRFIMIRPNRIEEGPLLNLSAALEGRLPIFAAVFLIVILWVLLGYYGHPLYQKLLLPLALGTLIYYLLTIGLIANIHISGMGNAARVSLGASFWLILTGLLLMIVQGIHISSKRMASQLISLVVIILTLLVGYKTGILSNISILKEFSSKSDRIISELIRHMQLALTASLTGLVISVFLGVKAYRKPKIEGSIKHFVNIMQVIPTLSFLGLLMIPLTFLSNQFPFLKSLGISGIGFFPAYIVLSLYTMLPITNNVLAGLKSIDVNILTAARGMGMTDSQRLFRIELPLALPAIYSGYKTALVQAVGNTILAGLVGGGGMGAILFLGLAQSAPDLVMISALLVVSVAFTLNILLSTFQPILIKHYAGGKIND